MYFKSFFLLTFLTCYKFSGISLKSYTKIISNPFLIAAMLGLLMAIIFPADYSKYKIVYRSERISGNDKKVFLQDVNHDGTYEKIIINYDEIMPRIGIRTIDDKVFGEASLKGIIKPEDAVAFCDVNHDAIDEAYTISRRGDSVFLSISELYLSTNISVKTKFLFSIFEVNGKLDYTPVSEFFFKDINQDSYLEVVFSYNALYSLQPRRIIVYEPKKDIIILSPLAGVKSNVFEITDYNGDGYSEIFVLNGTSENLNDTNSIPYHDYTPWLMILDHNMHFVTQPWPFSVKPATFFPFTIQYKDTLFLAGYLIAFGPNNLSSSMFHFTNDFKISERQDITFYPGLYLRGLLKLKNGNDLLCLIDDKSGEMLLYDYTFTLVKRIRLEPNSTPVTENKYFKKVTIKGKSFYVFQSHGTNPGFLLLDEFLQQVIRIDYPASTEKETFTHYKIYETNNGGVNFYIQSGNKLVEASISYDFFWFLNLWYYPAYFVLMLCLVFLLQYLLKQRLEQRRKIENEILSLQLKSTLAQLDPHFTFNAMNMISSLIATNRREEANNYLLQFSKIMRATVIEGEKIMIPLKQELTFVQDYLAMQQFRIGSDFEYHVRIPENVNSSLVVPKRIIHTHVENAIKHGLMHKEGNKQLSIAIAQSEKDLYIEVTDNGIGREEAQKMSPYKNTGQGMKIASQILNLTGNLTRKKYTQEIFDLKNDEGNAAGTKIVLRIEL